MKWLKVAHVLGAMLLLTMFNTPALAEVHQTKLEGFQEVPAVITPGSGHFKMKVAPGGASFDFELSYEGIEGGAITQAHIHVGQKNVNGGIVIYLCSNLVPPGGRARTAARRASPDNVTGTRTAEDVFAQPTQGVSALDFSAGAHRHPQR